jgi:hypothetical protein
MCVRSAHFAINVLTRANRVQLVDCHVHSRVDLIPLRAAYEDDRSLYLVMELAKFGDMNAFQCMHKALTVSLHAQ